MRPAPSVLLLTTLLGAGQGLFLALYAVELAARSNATAMPASGFFAGGGLLALALTAAGLVASVFHLGHPGRGWRAAAGWRTSWLSREIIALPAFMAALAAWTVAHAAGAGATAALGGGAAFACVALFACTAMIYASLRMIPEWASPLTLVNFPLLGCASGATLAAAWAAATRSPIAVPLAWAALVLTLAGFVTRLAALRRNRLLRPRSTLQTAIGVAHPVIAQRSQGQMGGSFNTREFFHGATPAKLRAIRQGFLLAAFAVPALLLAAAPGSAPLAAAAFAIQVAGLYAERWYFFAEANHPQNLYYQAIS